MLTLIVLTDFSPAADQALRYAAALAAPANAHVVLLHVRPSLLSSRAFTSPAAELSEAEANNRLRQRADMAGGEARVSYELLEGDVAHELTQVVRRHQPAAVVVGRPDLSEIPLELAHTTSLDLMSHTNCPLLVVPEGTQRQGQPKQVLLAVDGQPLPHYGAPNPLQPLLGHACLTVVVVGHTADEAALSLQLARAVGLTEGFPELRSNNIQHPEPAAGIAQAVEALQADMVVLPARRRSFLGKLFHQSVTAQVVSEATVPVLILPEREG